VTEDIAATTAVPGQRDPGPLDPGPLDSGPLDSGTAQADREKPQDHVTVCLPAEGAYLSVLRTATAGLAARLDFTLDEIEDLRIAVDEACAMLLSQAIPGTNLECAFDLGAEEMTITVSVTAAEPQIPARDTFAWTVLSALAGTVDSRLGADDQVSIVLRKRRETPVSGLGSGASVGKEDRASDVECSGDRAIPTGSELCDALSASNAGVRGDGRTTYQPRRLWFLHDILKP